MRLAIHALLFCGPTLTFCSQALAAAPATAPATRPANDKRIVIDPRQPRDGMFYWGLGSVRVRVVGVEDKSLVFDFTDEVEGGYTVYRCRIPADGPPATIELGVKKSGSSTWRAVVTSFDLAACEVIERGSRHTGRVERFGSATRPSTRPSR